jgi:hypothetical protein
MTLLQWNVTQRHDIYERRQQHTQSGGLPTVPLLFNSRSAQPALQRLARAAAASVICLLGSSNLTVPL